MVITHVVVHVNSKVEGFAGEMRGCHICTGGQSA